MISRWANKKPEAIALRRRGNSLNDIERMLGIPRSTLSGWLRSVELTEKQKLALKKRHEDGLTRARVAAVRWHNAQKQGRLEIAERNAKDVLNLIPNDLSTLELALAFLYLGEGSKTNSSTALGSSDSRIARFFVSCLREIYEIPTEGFTCYLHLRADQDPKKLKQFWSHALNLPTANFGKTSFDKRTIGRPTYPDYKGVCSIECGRVDIQRRLMYIAQGYCDKNMGVANLGG